MVGATCVGPKPLKPIGKGCNITIPANVPCNHKRNIFLLGTPTLQNCWTPSAHHPCIRNVVVAVRNRVIADVPKPTINGIRRTRAVCREIAKNLGTFKRESLDKILSYYKGRKLTIYTDALNSLSQRPLRRKDGNIQAFVKCERFAPTKKDNPDPRLIQARSPRFGVVISRYIKSPERQLYRYEGTDTRSRSRLIAKGLNSQQRGALARYKWNSFKEPVVMSIDLSRFDQHVSKELLQVEHEFYELLTPYKELHEILKWQINNKCTTRSGVKYTANGRRMSGDMNTALGNCILMIAMTTAFVRNLGFGTESVPYDLLDDGDDCLIFIERKDIHKIKQNITNFYLSVGHEVKVENIAYHFEDIEFCQAHPVMVSGKWKFVQNPFKTLSHRMTGFSNWQSSPRRMCTTLGKAELAISEGVPILQELGTTLLRLGGGAKVLNLEDDIVRRAKMERRDWGSAERTTISVDTRLSFCKAFKIPAHLQLAIEAELRRYHFDPGDRPEVRPPYYSNGHLFNPSKPEYFPEGPCDGEPSE